MTSSYALPRIKQVLTMYAPKVHADGNGLGGMSVDAARLIESAQKSQVLR